VDNAKEPIGVDYMSAPPMNGECILARFRDGLPEAVIKLIETSFLGIDQNYHSLL
jgi:hypothetical protein